MPDNVRNDKPEEEYRVTLSVQGDDAAPRFLNGDRLVCAPKAAAAVGDDIVVIIRDGNIRVGRLSSLEAERVIIEHGPVDLPIPRTEIGAIWPIRQLARNDGRLTAAD